MELVNTDSLMIGDWVKIGNKPQRVIQLTHYEDVDDTITLDLGEEYLDVEPIPLTTEILEENGFGYRSLGGAEEWFIADDYYDIVIYEWSDSIWVFRYECTEMNTPHEQRVFSYVHNLQHALRESGIEKEIVL